MIDPESVSMGAHLTDAVIRQSRRQAAMLTAAAPLLDLFVPGRPKPTGDQLVRALLPALMAGVADRAANAVDAEHGAIVLSSTKGDGLIEGYAVRSEIAAFAIALQDTWDVVRRETGEETWRNSVPLPTAQVLYEHARLLVEAIETVGGESGRLPSPEFVRVRCAEVALYALMLADVAGQLMGPRSNG